MTYVQLLEWIKASGFEQWSWVVAVLTALVFALRWLFKPSMPPALKPSPVDNSNSTHGPAQIGQLIGGSGHNVILNNQTDPALIQNLLDRLSSKDKELGAKDQLLQTQSAEIQALRREGVQTVVSATQKPQANAQALAALQDLKHGSVENVQKVLRLMEDMAAQAATPHRSEAGRLAREQGALWLGQSVEKAYAAFERAHFHDPLNLPTLFILTDLAKNAHSLSVAHKWADTALLNTEKLAASDPKNSDWQRDLSVSYEKVAGILEAQGERERALGEYQKSLAIREKLAASDPKNVQWQIDIVVSCWQHANVLGDESVKTGFLLRGLLLLKQLNVRAALSVDQVSWINTFEEKIQQLRGKM